MPLLVEVFSPSPELLWSGPLPASTGEPEGPASGQAATPRTGLGCLPRPLGSAGVFIRLQWRSSCWVTPQAARCTSNTEGLVVLFVLTLACPGFLSDTFYGSSLRALLPLGCSPVSRLRLWMLISYIPVQCPRIMIFPCRNTVTHPVFLLE